MAFELRIAGATDAPEISALVNQAYRPAAGVAGWTHESHLVAGDRTSTAQVLAQIQGSSTILLLCLDSKVVACVAVEGDRAGGYIGMLATAPSMQAQGLGKQMLKNAEDYAVLHLGASIFKMSVLSSRPELLAFYQRRGYVLTGATQEYPASAGVGQPMVDGIQVLLLVKTATC